MERVVIDIVGMSCQDCVRSVTAVLGALPGVAQVEVALEPGQVRLAYDPQLTSVAQFLDTIEAAGFDVR